MEQQITPLIYYYNPNIFPREEYKSRKEENKRYATALGVTFFDADYDHQQWKNETWSLRNEQERGERCSLCFQLRLLAIASFAHKNDYALFATTLATSRWKNLIQINQAGEYAASLFPM